MIDLLDELEAAEDERIVSYAFKGFGVIGEWLKVVAEDVGVVEGEVEVRDEGKECEPFFVVGGANGHFEEVEVAALLAEVPQIKEVAGENSCIFISAKSWLLQKPLRQLILSQLQS